MPRNEWFVVCLIGLSLAISTKSTAQLWSGVLSPPRGIPWTNAGITGGGGIPSGSWTQCGPTIQPYSGTAQKIIDAMKHTGTGYNGADCHANTYIQLAAGTFNLSSGIRNKGVSNTELRGMGTSQTNLVFSNGTTCQAGNTTCLISFEDNGAEYAGGNPTATAWTGGYAQGTNSITVASAANIVVNGTILVLDQCDDGYTGASCAGSAVATSSYFNCSDAYNPTGPTGCSYNDPDGNAARPHRWQSEFVQVTACNPSPCAAGATTLTIFPPLKHPNWASARTPMYWQIQANNYVGIQNLTVQAAGTTAGEAVGFNDVANFWLRGVAILNAYSQGLGMYLVDQGIVESNYIYNTGQGSVNSDPSHLAVNGSNVLMVNNIFQSSRISFMGNGPNSGNVFAYNFSVNCYEGNGAHWGCIWDGHSGGNDYNLFEGNVANQVFSDQTHGSKLMHTFYRNFLTGWESCGNGNCGSDAHKNAIIAAADPLSFNRYGNWVGNVMGTPGGPSSAGYSSTTDMWFLSGTTGYIWILGSGNSNAPPATIGGPIPHDPLVAATMLRWGNWDAFTNAVRWCGNSSNTGWSTTCSSISEVPSGISVYPNSIPTLGDTGGTLPASFFLSSRPSWWASSIPFPAIGPDVTGGNVGRCTGTLDAHGQFGGLPALSNSQCAGTSLASSWAGHVNAIPAMACYLSVMGGPPDGSGSALAFDANACYGEIGGGVAPPSGLQATAQ